MIHNFKILANNIQINILGKRLQIYSDKDSVIHTGRLWFERAWCL